MLDIPPLRVIMIVPPTYARVEFHMVSIEHMAGIIWIIFIHGLV